MIDSDLSQLTLTNPRVRERLAGRQRPEAVQLASELAVGALCDWAIAELASGELAKGIKRLEDALNEFPSSRLVFHNLAAVLLANRELRGANLNALQRRLMLHEDRWPWMREYRRLLWMPHFLNIEFVGGKCNLRCRMCLGTNSDVHTNRLTHMSAADFRMALKAAPTVSGLSISASDSEPLLHPELDAIFAAAREFNVPLDIFTNGQMLNARIARLLVNSQAVRMINFSVDAATAETYRKIHGANFEALLGKIEMLAAMRNERNVSLPWFSFSFVAMADTIQELPDFVELARRLGAHRVLVGDLIGWDDRPSENRVATENPQCFEFVGKAQRRAAEADIRLQLPERLRPANPPDVPFVGASDGLPAPPAEPAVASAQLKACGWIGGVWVRQNGEFDPCCLIHAVADMGNVRDGSLVDNAKFARVKSLLLDGKVFPQCANQRMCQFVQQQHAAGIPLRIITKEDLGELAPVPASSVNAERGEPVTADQAA